MRGDADAWRLRRDARPLPAPGHPALPGTGQGRDAHLSRTLLAVRPHHGRTLRPARGAHHPLPHPGRRRLGRGVAATTGTAPVDARVAARPGPGRRALTETM